MLVGWGVVANILAGAETVEEAEAAVDAPGSASVGRVVAADGSESSLQVDSTLEIASDFPASVDGGTCEKSAAAALQKTCAFSSADRLAAGACASGTEFSNELGDFVPGLDLRLADAVPPLLLSNSLSTVGFAMGCVFWFASANAVENFPGIGLPPVACSGIFTEIWGKLTITASPQPGSECARGSPDGSD